MTAYIIRHNATGLYFSGFDGLTVNYALREYAQHFLTYHEAFDAGEDISVDPGFDAQRFTIERVNA
jgi:hypothetical protein